MMGDAKSSRRQIGARGRWARRLFLVLVLTGLAGVGYYLVGFAQSSDEFNLTTVRLEGLKVLTEEEVLVASGVSSGDSVLQLDRARIKAGIETLSYVESADVTLVFPDTMVVRVVERAPVATLIVRNAAFELDRAGVVLRRYAEGRIFMTPLITQVGDIDVVDVGDQLQSPALLDALQAWDALTDTGIPATLTLSEIAARSTDEILMFFDEVPFEIRWGRGDVRDQAQRLKVLWDEQKGQLGCEEYLDLRFGDDLVCK